MSDPRVDQDPEHHVEDSAMPAEPLVGEPTLGEPTPAVLSEDTFAASAEPAPAGPEVAAASSGPAPTPAGPRPYAVIETGGKQYRVSIGDRISVEKLPVEAGGQVVIDRVLLLGGDGATRVGAPVVTGAAVTATVEEQFRGEKLIIFKYKAKKRYRRRTGHRQSLTRLTITGITG